MTTVTKKSIRQSSSAGGGTPYGNYTVNRYSLETNSSGVLVDSDQTTALVQTNVVRIGVLPAGIYLDSALALVNDVFTASATCKVGFQYVDGTDSTAVPQDDDYFFTALDLNTLARVAASNTTVRPVKLPKPAYLIVTIAGADLAAAGIVDFLILGESGGVA